MKIDVLGVQINADTKNTILFLIKKLLAENQKIFIVTPYSEMIVAAQKDREFRAVLNSADFALPDGIGTLWATFGLVTNRGTDSTAYTGNQGNTGCLDHGGANVCKPNAPLETQGGVGTRDVHWRETTFRTELMTGFLSPVGVASPLSRMSIGSLADMGYTVNFSTADSYTVPAAVTAGAVRVGDPGIRSAMRLGELLLAPKFSVDARGRVTRLAEMR